MGIRLPFLDRAPVVSVLRLQGAIGAGPRAGLSDQAMAPLIEKAFARGRPKAVCLVINSPGGSPVQSSLIAARIRRLADDRKVPVYAFVEDAAASGGYWIAAAADEIWADPGSIVGSIGVVSSGFGAQVFLARQGIERRIHTAGRSKTMLDPFSEEKPEDVERLNRILHRMHALFIEHVRSRRGDKLDTSAPGLFEGEFWLGEEAREIGLIDGVGHIVPEMKRRFGRKVRFRRYEAKKGLLRRFGGAMISDALGGLEEQALWARYGL